MIYALFHGLVNWIATTILVESELFRPVRQWLERRTDSAGQWWWAWEKLRYLAGCHLCVGTWVGLTQAATFGSPWRGVWGLLAGGLLYKAIGHLVLELRPQAWMKG